MRLITTSSPRSRRDEVGVRSMGVGDVMFVKLGHAIRAGIIQSTRCCSID